MIPRYLCSLLFCVTFVVYLATLSPSIVGGDSSELILAAHFMGTAHPPGYPLFTLLGKLFSLLPLGAIAWRVNLLSAVCNSATASFLFLTVTRLTKNQWAGLVAGGLFAFSPLSWTYATQTEVFALNNLMMTGLLFGLTHYFESKSFQKLYALTFWCGLSICNHHTSILFILPAGLWIFWKDQRRLLKLNVLSKIALCFLMGLTPYLYLFWAGSNPSLFVWGDFSTIQGFLDHFLRKQYGTFVLGGDRIHEKVSLFSRTELYFMALPSQLFVAFPCVALALSHFIKTPSKKREEIKSLFLVLFLFYLLVFVSLANLDIDTPLKAALETRFWQQPNLICFIFAGLGFASFSTYTKKLPHLFMPAITVALIALQGGAHYLPQRSANRLPIFETFAESVITELPPHSILISSGDHLTHSLLYVQTVKGIRPDVMLVDQNFLLLSWYKPHLIAHYPDLTIPGSRLMPGLPGAYSLKDFFDANIHRFNIYLINGFRIEDNSYEATYEAFPFGPYDRILPKLQEPSFNEWYSWNRDSFSKINVNELQNYPNGSWEHELFRLYWRQNFTFGSRLMMHASQHPEHFSYFEEGIQILEKVVSQYPLFRPELFQHSESAYANLVNGYKFLSQTRPEFRAKVTESLNRYLSVLPESSPARESILNELKQVSTGH